MEELSADNFAPGGAGIRDPIATHVLSVYVRMNIYSKGSSESRSGRLCCQRETELVPAIPFADLPDHAPQPIHFAAFEDLERCGSVKVSHRLVPPSL